MRGYFGIGVYYPKYAENIGTLWRSAYSFGASFIFTIGKEYKEQPSDTSKAWKNIPLYHYSDFKEMKDLAPLDAKIVGVELVMDSLELLEYNHHERAIYLLGNESKGLPVDIQDQCDDIVEVSGAHFCLNVSVAGSIVIYDRVCKA